VFGSVARGDARPGSDVDLLVELVPGKTLVDLAGFRSDARRIIRLDVDVVTPETVEPRFRDAVLKEAVPL
jgi:predicted nucleotidyltransferase